MTFRSRFALSLSLCAFLLASGSAFAAPAAPDLAYLRLPPDGRAALAAARVTPVTVVDHGAFLWVGVDPGDLAALAAGGIGPAADFTLRLGETSFDPRRESPAVPEAWSAAGEGADLRLVQVIGPVRGDWPARLEAAGLRVVQYVHPFTYVVWGGAPEAARAGALDFVRWAGPFLPAYRVLPRWRELGEAPVRVDATLYRGADLAAAVAELERLGATAIERRAVDGTFEIATMSLPGSRFAEAARVPGVYSLQPVPTDGGLRGEMSDQVNVGNVDGANLAFPGYLAWLAGVGLSGAGVTMANVDDGVNHTHPDLVNRMLPCTGTTCSGGSSSHGTHTAGIMAADGSSGMTSGGFLRGLGVAPGAKLFEQVYSPHYQSPGGMLLLMQQSFANGAELSGNSWGPSGSPQGYDDDTRQVDVGVRDADPVAAGNQPFGYVLSFMNGNGGTSSQGTPDEAKNVFTVGSTKMQNTNGSQILAIDDLSSNSAHGPALDGRKIPHLVAPGCRVDSTTTATGYGLLCGTSMASPHVAGATALFLERYRGLFATDPSPAMVKAAFLPAAHDLAGHLDADGGTLGHPFDSKQGWGRMDLAAVVDPQVEVLYFDDPVRLTATGQQWTVALEPADPGLPMKLMLVWTDAPGHGLGGSTPAWNNDLDLVVETGSGTFRGNVFAASGWSATGGVADTRNNTEGVFLGPAPPGAITVRVVASNLASDGVPGEGTATDQDFALVCRNCASGALFADGFESGGTGAWSATVP